MFGFSKSNLSTGEATYLLLALLHMHLVGHVRHNEKMDNKLSSRLIQLWLQRHNRNAGFMYRAKMSTAGEAIFLHFMSTHPKNAIPIDSTLEHVEHAVLKPEENPGLVAGAVILLCKTFVIKWGLALENK